MSEAGAITCPKCLHPVFPSGPPALGSAEEPCNRCGATLVLETFPRLYSGESSTTNDARNALLAQEGEAVCHFYPELQAQTVCDECGCFMSQKAAIAWGEKTLCLPCLHQLREAKNRDDFSARRTLVDNVGLALVGLLLPLSLFTGPIAVVYLLRNRKKPGSLVPRSRFRWWLALGIAISVTVGWFLLITFWILSLVNAITS